MAKWGFSGISTFAHLEHIKCLTNTDTPFDIALIGAPFDTAVSYRPGARFGPKAIRAASARQTSFRGFNARAGLNPYTSWAKIIDCGDIPITPFDNELALRQMSEAYIELGAHPSTNKVGKPKLITLGGDHSIALPALRALQNIYGQSVAVLHFDSHLDTWHPAKYPSVWESRQSDFNHGSMFWIASNEGLILNGSSVHAGLRTRLSGDGWDDYEDDDRQGFLRISADDIDDLGTAGIISSILERIGTEVPVYLSIDIDVIDPGLAPGTGTPEPGGWTTRELIKILRGIDKLNVVGADIVEVAPSYDGPGEVTALAGAQLGFELITSIVKRGIIDGALDGLLKPEAEPGKDEL
ncbi:MAG: Guanidinobutyrase [Cirrosporium novae-zelandiae]|nr:MAG: Guanidinobutyrase [Cirrosporium novae-zelandiae]